MSYWGEYGSLVRISPLSNQGYKFEAVALIPDIWDQVSREYIENRESLVVDNIQQYCSVVQTGIGSSTLILGGEVDAGKFYTDPCRLF
jgi:RAT1-interacting protein